MPSGRALLSYIHKWRVNMAEKKLGRQTPTISVILPYTETLGGEAIEMYDKSSRNSLEWQQRLVSLNSSA